GTLFRIEERTRPGKPLLQNPAITYHICSQGSLAEFATEVSDAEKRTERPGDADRPLHTNGPALPLLLAARPDGRRAAGERMPTGAGQDPVRAAARLPRHRRSLRPDRRVLRPSRRVALVRSQ